MAITPNLMMAAILSGAFYGLMNLFAGFVITKPQFPGWWIWVSAHHWLLVCSLFTCLTCLLTTVQNRLPSPLLRTLRIHQWLGTLILILQSACHFVACLVRVAFETVNNWVMFRKPSANFLLEPMCLLENQCADKCVSFLQMYYLNPVTWTLYGLVASNVGDVVGNIALNDGPPISVQQFLLDRFDYRHSFLGWVVLILVGWIVVFWALGAYAFKRFNFQKR